MDSDEIEHMVCVIMHRDGPDGHLDGADKITDFIMALLEGHGDKWADWYGRDFNG